MIETVELMSSRRFESKRWSLAGLGGGRFFSVILLALVAAALFFVHARWVFTHFSNDPYLLDSGWFAYLFGSNDPLLKNPAAVNDLSFYAHHLSPHIFLFGRVVDLLPGTTGIEVFAYHEGLFFGLVFVSLWLLSFAVGMRPGDRVIVCVAAMAVGAFANVLWQTAAYPHYEIATFALAVLALVAWVAERPTLFVVSLLWLPLIREDGPFYAAFVCLACAALQLGERRSHPISIRTLVLLSAASLAAGVAAFGIKAVFFPGFDAFSSNFSGDGWQHLSADLIRQRVTALVRNLNIAPVLLGVALLTLRDVRYAAGLVLLSPLFLVHILSHRDQLGLFTLYYALPWLLAWIVCICLFVRRAMASRTTRFEGAVLVAASLTMAAPIHAVLGSGRHYWYVPHWAVTRPVRDIAAMQRFALQVRSAFLLPSVSATDRGVCVSQGIAALVPDDFTRQELLTDGSDLTKCHAIMLFRGEIQYSTLSSQAAAIQFSRVAADENAELWVR
jgi:hypothetical protein